MDYLANIQPQCDIFLKEAQIHLSKSKEIESGEFSFNQIDSLSSNPKFSVQINCSKLKKQNNVFPWYRNRNIPRIQISKKEDSNEKFFYYVSACYSEKGDLVQTRLNGDDNKLSGCACSFSSLKFQATSFILHGSQVRLLIIIANDKGQMIESYISLPIYITSWKNYLNDQPSKHAVFSPFTPINLLRAVQEDYQQDGNSKSSFKAVDTALGLSEYFQGSTIKQKISHPLFLALSFPKTLILHISVSLLPSIQDQSSLEFKRELLINLQKYFLNSLMRSNKNKEQSVMIEIVEKSQNNLSEKVRNFLKKIYSDCIYVSNKHEKKPSTNNKFKQLNFEDFSSWLQVYKESFFTMEMMIINSQLTSQQNQQSSTYIQGEILKVRSSNQQNMFKIPNLEITLSNNESLNLKRIPVLQESHKKNQSNRQSHQRHFNKRSSQTFENLIHFTNDTQSHKNINDQQYQCEPLQIKKRKISDHSFVDPNQSGSTSHTLEVVQEEINKQYMVNEKQLINSSPRMDNLTFSSSQSIQEQDNFINNKYEAIQNNNNLFSHSKLFSQQSLGYQPLVHQPLLQQIRFFPSIDHLQQASFLQVPAGSPSGFNNFFSQYGIKSENPLQFIHPIPQLQGQINQISQLNNQLLQNNYHSQPLFLLA